MQQFVCQIGKLRHGEVKIGLICRVDNCIFNKLIQQMFFNFDRGNETMTKNSGGCLLMLPLYIIALPVIVLMKLVKLNK